jgi:DNA repair protein RadC
MLDLLIGKIAAAKIIKSGINVLTATENELTYIAGEGAAKKLVAAKSVMYPVRDVSKIKSSQDAADLILPYLRNLDHEEFYVIALSNSNEVIEVIKISEGGKTATVVDASILFKRLLISGAKGFILSHNHPSGQLRPSQEDLNLTKKIKEGATLLDMKLLDHVIIGHNNQYYSFADEGCL